ncbi:hypothetical protein NL676_019317 [Syzygium grande]|nr:hypothetical protein NL676_019317 [Syzygium grande]
MKNSAESENMNWIIANSKPCPKCKRPTEKNQGCMHMTCTPPSKFEFCQLLLGACILASASTAPCTSPPPSLLPSSAQTPPLLLRSSMYLSTLVPLLLRSSCTYLESSSFSLPTLVHLLLHVLHVLPVLLPSSCTYFMYFQSSSLSVGSSSAPPPPSSLCFHCSVSLWYPCACGPH